MSGFDYDALPAWPEDDDQAHDVSAAPEYDVNVMATRCGMDERGDVAYLEDVPLVVRRGVPVRFGEFSFYALMAEPRDKSRSASLHGKDLVMATFPVARGWYDHGNFQFGTKHKARNPGKEIEQAFASQPRLRRDLLQRLGRNPFDTRHDVATAVLCDPYALDPLKKFILGRQSYYGARGGRSSPQSLMAICEDLSTLRQHLSGNTLLREMVNATFESRDLFLRFHRSLLASLPSPSTAGIEIPGKDSAKYMIFPEIADSRLAGEVMRASVDLALAGPENFEEFRENLDEDREPDGRKLAKHRARDIYLQLYFNLWKRTGRARRAADRTRFLRKDPAQKNIDAQEKDFWKESSRLSGEIDLSPGGIQATAETMLAEYTGRAAEYGLLIGPRHQDNRSARVESEHWTAAISFLLHAAAILDAGHRPPGLSALLDELEKDDVENIRMVTGWVKAKHSI